jgi:two-component sensor histidine kinase
MAPFRIDRLQKFIPADSAEPYAFAAFCVAIAALIRWSIGIFVEGVVPFAAFFPAALFAAFVGGKGPGAFVVALGGVIGWWAFFEPAKTFLPLSLSQQISLIFYALTGLLIVWAADHYRKVTKRLEDAEKFRQLAVEELAHRLKNKVATIQAIISLRLREDPQTRDELLSCLTSLRATDDLIIATQGKGARISDILSAELRPYDAARLSIAGPEILLPPKLALTAALIFHELATNAAKYGALSLSPGKVSVRWSCSNSRLNVEWVETGGPSVSLPDHQGFGTRLFLRALQQFEGEISTTFATTGLIFKMNVPISEDSPSIVPPVPNTSGAFAAD